MSKKPRKGGTSARLKAVQADIAAGVEPLAAFERHGYKYPRRELQRRALQVAEARNADPIGVCMDVLRFGDIGPKIAAAGVILGTRESGSDNSTDARMITPIAVTPNDMHTNGFSVRECDVPEGAVVHATLEDAVTAGVAAFEAPKANGGTTPHQLARATLNEIMLRGVKCSDTELVAAARAALRDNPEPQQQKARESFAFILPTGGLIPHDDEPVTGNGPLPPNGAVVYYRADPKELLAGAIVAPPDTDDSNLSDDFEAA